MKRVFILITLASACLLFVSCAIVGPNYKVPPQLNIPESYPNQNMGTALVPNGEIAQEWWKLFGDPDLDYLINEAAKSNLSLGIAATRVYEARAQYYTSFSGILPSVGASGSVTKQENYSVYTTPNNPHGVYGAGGTASWELDLFGRVRRSIEAGQATWDSAREDYTDVLISLYGDVANLYINIRTTQLQLMVAEENLKSQREVYNLTKTLFDNGLVGGLDVAQAQRVLSQTETVLPLLRMALSQQINAMSILLGREPAYLYEFLSIVKPVPTPADQINIAIPANLLRQRPDIRRAERSLEAAVARIGVAEGELYPKLTFDGILNFSAISIGSLFTPDTRAFSIGPTLSWNIFSGGAVQAGIDFADAQALQAIYNYEGTVLNALYEVDNAMKAFYEYKKQYISQEQVVMSARESERLSLILYKEGLINFQSVLDSQIARFSAETDMAASQGQAALNMVAIYKAIGGGWDPDSPPAVPDLRKTLREVENTGGVAEWDGIKAREVDMGDPHNLEFGNVPFEPVSGAVIHAVE